jgi:hypothetical protein
MFCTAILHVLGLVDAGQVASHAKASVDIFTHLTPEICVKYVRSDPNLCRLRARPSPANTIVIPIIGDYPMTVR